MASNQDTEEGLERLRSVVRANPRSTTFVALAHALCDTGRAGEAEEVCREGLVQHPRLVTGQVALGRALIDRGQLPEAQEVLVEAAKSSPEHGDVFRWLGELVLRRGDQARARAILEYAEELLPTDGRVSELLTQAGGTPSPRAPRLKTDLDDTRVGNTRALADRMHEDPPVFTSAGAPSAPPPPPRLEEDDPTAVRSAREVQTWASAALPSPLAAAPLSNGAAALLPKVPAKVRGASPPPSPPPGPVAPRGGTAAVAGGSRARALPRPRLLAVLGGGLLAAAGLGALGLRPRKGPAAPVVTAAELGVIASAGTLDGLQEARARGRALLESVPFDPDAAAALAFIDGLLATDYGLPTAADVLEAAGRAEQARPAVAERSARLEAARALAALASGDVAEARVRGERAVAAGPDVAEARLALARARTHGGEDARANLDRALAHGRELATAVLDRAALDLDGGDATSAAARVRAWLEKHGGSQLRARLLLAETERASTGRSSPGPVIEACRQEGLDAPLLRAGCELDAAASARLRGDRTAALKGAQGVLAGAGHDVRLVARTALLLSLLGELDAAAAALSRIANATAPGYAPRAWAERAIALGRGTKVGATPLLDRPGGPAARLVAARVAFADGGAAALGDVLSRWPGALVAADPELAALAERGRSAAPAAGEGGGSVVTKDGGEARPAAQRPHRRPPGARRHVRSRPSPHRR